MVEHLKKPQKRYAYEVVPEKKISLQLKKPDEAELVDFYEKDRFSRNVSLMKFFLMPFVFVALLGFPAPGIVGNYVNLLSHFAALAFFIFCGFFVLVPDDAKRMRKLKRALKRSSIFFLILFAGYFAVNVFYLWLIGSLKSLTAMWRLRAVFDFLVLNVWPLPMGSSIWFVQSLLYAYLIFFILEKLELSKFYTPLLVVLLVFMLFSGEFAKLAGFPHFGYYYIPGGTLTKTLPFMLIGMLLRKNIAKLARIPRYVYMITFFAGALCAIGEFLLLQRLGLLVYTHNAIGFAVMALSVCCFAISKPEAKESFLAEHGGHYARRMYVLCQPVFMLLWLFHLRFHPLVLSSFIRFGSVICFPICFGLAFVIGWVKFRFDLWHGKRKI